MHLLKNFFLSTDFPLDSDCLAVKNKGLKIMKEFEYRALLNGDFDFNEKKRNNANNKNNINNCSKYTEYRSRKEIQLKSIMRMNKLEKERNMARMRQYADSRMTYAPSFFLGPPLSYHPNNNTSNGSTLLPPSHPFLPFPFQSDATSSFFSLPHLGLGPRPPGHFGARNDRPRHQMFPHRFSDHHSILPSFAFDNND